MTVQSNSINSGNDPTALIFSFQAGVVAFACSKLLDWDRTYIEDFVRDILIEVAEGVKEGRVVVDNPIALFAFLKQRVSSRVIDYRNTAKRTILMDHQTVNSLYMTQGGTARTSKTFRPVVNPNSAKALADAEALFKVESKAAAVGNTELPGGVGMHGGVGFESFAGSFDGRGSSGAYNEGRGPKDPKARRDGEKNWAEDQAISDLDVRLFIQSLTGEERDLLERRVKGYSWRELMARQRDIVQLRKAANAVFKDQTAPLKSHSGWNTQARARKAAEALFSKGGNINTNDNRVEPRRELSNNA